MFQQNNPKSIKRKNLTKTTLTARTTVNRFVHQSLYNLRITTEKTKKIAHHARNEMACNHSFKATPRYTVTL